MDKKIRKGRINALKKNVVSIFEENKSREAIESALRVFWSKEFVWGEEEIWLPKEEGDIVLLLVLWDVREYIIFEIADRRRM